MIRLDKYLCDMQLGTRSEVKELIKKGKVSINGAVALKADLKIDEDKDVVSYEGNNLNYRKYHYYLLNKPAGVVTATHDNHDKTVMDLLIGAEGKNLSPVGRLDKDTEGLLLITDDGMLNHNLLSPKKHVDKTYYVECDGSIDDDKLKALQEGVDIGDEKITLPAKAKLLKEIKDETKNQYIIELTIHEGRFHQVKRMIEAIGGEVTYLKRLTFGALHLDKNLPLGDFRELTLEEVEELKKED